MPCIAGLLLAIACALLLFSHAARAQGQPVPPASSAACAVDTSLASSDASRAAFNTLLQAMPALPQVKLISSRRFTPTDTEADVFAVDPAAATLRYRVFVGDDAAATPPALVADTLVWSEAAPPQTAGIDAGPLDDKRPKTIVHFTLASSGQWFKWERRRVYVLACGAGNVPLHVGQFQTHVTTKDTCRLFALLLCLLFYVMAALTSHRVHVASQRFPGQATARGLKGTNYASRWRHFDPVIMTANQNGRGSATKLQVLFFSLLVFGVVAYIWMTTGNLSKLSQSILYLLGISGIGATAAAATEVSRKRLTFENWAWLINRKWLPDGGAAEVNRAEWKDIVMSNNEFDVSRFQMVIFSVLVGASLLTAGGPTADLSDFTIPGEILGILGLSQVVYVAGKFVDGPSIEQLDAQITVLRQAETALQAALASSATATTAAGTPDDSRLRLNRRDLPEPVGKAYDDYVETWDRTRTMFQSTLSEAVSAVAQGFRPPFPYLSLPADAMVALKKRYASVNGQLIGRETALAASGVQDDARKAGEIGSARTDYAAALQAAEAALAAFHKAQKDNEEATSMTPRDVDARYEGIARHETATRAALDQLRESVAQLERLLSTS